MNKCFALLFIGALATTLQVPAQNLILNGNFGTGNFTDWTTSGVAFGVVGTSSDVNPPVGDSFMVQADGNDTLTQTFDTTLDQTYTLSFDNANSAGPNNQGGVYLSGSINGATLFTDTTDLSNTSWLTHTYDFTATSTTTTLQLDMNYYNANGNGLLDDVSVTATPEPSTLSLSALGGLGGLLIYRRRKC
jgi:Protein of unknown function (DUF642)/PEP-CTERM motif